MNPGALVDGAEDVEAVGQRLSVAFASRAGLGVCGSSPDMLARLREAVGDRATTLCGYVFKEVRRRACGVVCGWVVVVFAVARGRGCFAQRVAVFGRWVLGPGCCVSLRPFHAVVCIVKASRADK